MSGVVLDGPFLVIKVRDGMVQLVTPGGTGGMTPEEARELGRSLIGAAESIEAREEKRGREILASAKGGAK